FTVLRAANWNPMFWVVAGARGLATASRTWLSALLARLVMDCAELAHAKSCIVVGRVIACGTAATDCAETGPCIVRVPFKSTSSSQYRPPLPAVLSIQP